MSRAVSAKPTLSYRALLMNNCAEGHVKIRQREV